MKLHILLFLLFISATVFSRGIRLKNGDLIFQEACPSDMENAIKQVTSSIDSYQFTHVGIVYVDEWENIYVLEATTPRVVLTPLKEYLSPKKGKACSPVSVVGRLKEKYQPLIPKALEIGLTLIDRVYDYGFVLGNDSYYCSELVYEILRQANDGEEVFQLNVMTFKSPGCDETAKGWIQHFEKHVLPIPEGEYGINPGAMSRSAVVEMIGEVNCSMEKSGV